jgi:hypothetical protein
VFRGVSAVALATLALVAGMGWLYLLRDIGALGAGPHMARALPLQQLDRSDAQPLLRIAVAWLPAGWAAGAALAWGLRGASRWTRAAVTLALAVVVLFATAALADAVAVSGDVVSRLPEQLSREGIWAEIGFLVIGSLLAGRWSRAGSRAAATAANPR